MQIQSELTFSGQYTESWPNIILRGVGSHTQLPSQLVDWSYGEISTHAILHSYGGIRGQSTEKQVFKDVLTGRTSTVGFVFFPF